MTSNNPPPSTRRRILAGDILRKGGAHGPSRKAMRSQAKRELQKSAHRDT